MGGGGPFSRYYPWDLFIYLRVLFDLDEPSWYTAALISTFQSHWFWIKHMTGGGGGFGDGADLCAVQQTLGRVLAIL